MVPIIAKCGYRCDLCPAFETNLGGDEDRHRMSEALARYYNYTVPPDQISPCKGCLAAEQLPDPECPVYPCVTAKGIDNCAHCEDFGCDKLKARMDVVEDCLANHPDVPPQDFKSYFEPYLAREALVKIRRSLDA